tara:strand:+ start:131766 stop:134912 length:3147 start_codon:yes stop_codon:yes gene_type:complete
LQHNTTFSIYNASAGSGKTFTLVKLYLTKILSSKTPDAFKSILAITFTNKAVSEMKERILESLISISESTQAENLSPMLMAVSEETNLTPSELKVRAKNALHYILHNFSNFDVETIDRFNHRLIRTFARDLKLSTNFEVDLDIDLLMSEAIDRVISKVGIDEKLTSVILDFSIEKLEDDKSWDISKDLKDISRLLYSENDLKHFELLKNKTGDDFLLLKKNLINEKALAENELNIQSQHFFKLIESNGISASDFSGGYLPKFIEKIATGDYTVKFDAVWQRTLGEKPLYPQKVPNDIKAAMDAITPEIVVLFNTTKDLIHHHQFLDTLLRNVNSLSLLNAINQEFMALQQEKNVLPISEFNSKIHNEIKEQPTPFIYERLGERYRHYFIDEFQDTSQLQWKNLIPLIDNALSQGVEGAEQGSLLLVGDAKQSIYRWRGGNPEQFISLYGVQNPFSASEKKIETLDTNYRSCEEIVNFNNSFFTFVSEYFQSENHGELYKIGNTQKSTSKANGYVSFSFIEAKNKEESFEVYPEKVLQIINMQFGKGYAPKDICVLVRKNVQGVAIAETLANNDIKVVSSEALILENIPEITFVINVLKLILNFEDKKAKADALYFLHSKVKTDISLHEFISEFLSLERKAFQEKLKTYAIHFEFDSSSSITIYDLCESICNVFLKETEGIAYLQTFLEFVYEFSLSQNTTINEFLNYWDSKKGKLSIEVSERLNAVKIMTVHKAKGLEFPVVIYPFADDDIYSYYNEKVWFPLDETKYSGFSEMLVPVSGKLENFGDAGRRLFDDFKIKAELDKINLVYVAMTRAAEQLFVISDAGKAKKENTIATLFKNYLLRENRWDETGNEYTFGNPDKPEIETKIDGQIETTFFDSFPETTFFKEKIKIATHKSMLWDTKQEKAIEKGDLLHNLLSKIHTRKDIGNILKSAVQEGVISNNQVGLLLPVFEKITTHPQLINYFENPFKIETERDIFTSTGESQRPDRLNYIDEKTMSIIDYKTGVEKLEDKNQIKYYGALISEMGFQVKELLLVYIKDEIEVVTV